MVLFIVLIVLLVLTVVSVTTLNTSSIQTYIARNTQLKHIAFQNAESTVKAGEITWDAALSVCLRSLAECSMDITPSMITDMEAIDWEAISGLGVTEYGKYVIEYLGWRPVPGSSVQRLLLYRITGRGVSSDTQAVTYVQTVYAKCVKKDGAVCAST